MSIDLLANSELMELVLQQSEIQGVVGNEKVKKHVLLACCSTFNLNPDYTFNLTLQQESGLGKSTVAKSIVRLFPENKVLMMSRMSEKALFHMQEPLDRKIVFIEEMSGNDAIYGTKIAISEHQLSSRTVEKVAGTFKTQHKRVSMMGTSFITTTTKQPFDREFESRVLRVYPENSDSYKTEVIDSIKQGVRDVKENETVPHDGLEDTRQALSGVGIYAVSVPFVDKIINTKLFTGITNPFRITKIMLAQVQAHALLYQKQRQVEDGCIIAQPEDYMNIRDLLEDVVNPPDPELIQLREYVEEREFDVTDVMNIFGVRQSQAYNILKRFKGRGVITGTSSGKYKVQNISLPEITITHEIPPIPPIPQDSSDLNLEKPTKNSTDSTHYTDFTAPDEKSSDNKKEQLSLYVLVEKLEKFRLGVGPNDFGISDIMEFFALNESEARELWEGWYGCCLINKKMYSNDYEVNVYALQELFQKFTSRNYIPSTSFTSSEVHKDIQEELDTDTNTNPVETVENRKEEESPQEWILRLK